MRMPPVSEFMSTEVWTIAPAASIAEAHRLMRGHRIRHLPVLDDGMLVGVVSQGDLHLLETLEDFALDAVDVREAMTERPYVVRGDTPLDEVAAAMAEMKVGSAIVVGNDGIEGIFTTIDACRALADVLGSVRTELATDLGEGLPAD